MICEFEHFDFDVEYHQELGYISEKYLPGFDVIELPKEFLSDPKYLQKNFYWLGKCADMAYVFGLGDRGHNELFFIIIV